MKAKFIVNNYTLGAKVKSTPTDKIISQKRIDKSHTEIIYELSSIRELDSCRKILSTKEIIIY